MTYVSYFEIEQDGTAGVHTCEYDIAVRMVEAGQPRYACIIGVTDEGTPTVLETLVDNDSYLDRRAAIETAQYIYGD